MNNSNLYYLSLIIEFIVFFGFQSCSAQSNKTIEEQRVGSLIDSISCFLNQYYVFPDVAKKIEVQLKEEYANGHFNKIKSDEEFAEKVMLI